MGKYRRDKIKEVHGEQRNCYRCEKRQVSFYAYAFRGPGVLGGGARNISDPKKKQRPPRKSDGFPISEQGDKLRKRFFTAQPLYISKISS